MSNTKNICDEILETYFDAEIHPRSDVQLSKYLDIPRDVILNYRKEHNIPTYIDRYKNMVDKLLVKVNEKNEEKKAYRWRLFILNNHLYFIDILTFISFFIIFCFVLFFI